MKRFLLKTLVLVLALAALPAISAGLAIFTGPAGTNPIQFPAAIADFNNVINQINAALNLNGVNGTNVGLRPMGMIYTRTTTVGNTAATGEQTLDAFTLAANTFDQPGRRIHVRASFFNAANNGQKHFKCYVGANGTGFAADPGTRSDNAATSLCDLYVTAYTTTNSEMVSGWVASGATSGSSGLANNFTPLSQSSPALTLTWNSNTAIPISVTGMSGNGVANDVILQDFQIEYAN